MPDDKTTFSIKQGDHDKEEINIYLNEIFKPREMRSLIIDRYEYIARRINQEGIQENEIVSIITLPDGKYGILYYADK